MAFFFCKRYQSRAVVAVATALFDKYIFEHERVEIQRRQNSAT